MTYYDFLYNYNHSNHFLGNVRYTHFCELNFSAHFKHYANNKNKNLKSEAKTSVQLGCIGNNIHPLTTECSIISAL